MQFMTINREKPSHLKGLHPQVLLSQPLPLACVLTSEGAHHLTRVASQGKDRQEHEIRLYTGPYEVPTFGVLFCLQFSWASPCLFRTSWRQDENVVYFPVLCADTTVVEPVHQVSTYLYTYNPSFWHRKEDCVQSWNNYADMGPSPSPGPWP